MLRPMAAPTSQLYGSAGSDISIQNRLSQRLDHLIVSENPLFSFLALFAALFSIKVLTGFFLFCFLVSLPLLMLAAPYIWV
jgi:hypothetical protein